MEGYVMRPDEIEKKSFAIIQELLGEKVLAPAQAPVIQRVIHTTADFEYADTLYFSPDALEAAEAAFGEGAHIVCDTNMALAGVNKSALSRLGGQAHCFMADADVAEEAQKRQVTRAWVSMEKAAKLQVPLIIAVGNAPTALLSLWELIQRGEIAPRLVIAVPVGFVNVVEAKELFVEKKVPAIVNRGRKGGSNVAAAICNALMYTISPR